MTAPLRDRRHAGQVLAQALDRYRGQPGLVVLALPRGGVPVAFEVARALEAPLDVFVVRKLGMPGFDEYAIGAIASGGVQVLNGDAGAGINPEALQRIVTREQAELARREHLYRGGRPPLTLQGMAVIVVDDGLATGSTMRAAVLAIRRHRPRCIVAAAPVGAPSTCRMLAAEADDVVCPYTPEPFRAVGLWYGDFPQTGDAEVHDLLAQAQPVPH